MSGRTGATDRKQAALNKLLKQRVVSRQHDAHSIQLCLAFQKYLFQPVWDLLHRVQFRIVLSDRTLQSPDQIRYTMLYTPDMV